MPHQSPSKLNPIQDYVTVAERIEKFYQTYPQGRIITSIVHHDLERGFILMRAEVYRYPDDALPAATGHAYEFKDAGYVQRTSYIETGETSAVGRALAFLNFETKRGIASREEMEKAARMLRREGSPTTAVGHSKASSRVSTEENHPAAHEQKEEILNLLENLRPGDRQAQRRLLTELTGKQSREDLTRQEAQNLIESLKREADEGSI